MRRILLICCLLLIGCATRQTFVTDPAIIQSHPTPIKVFGIGYWKPGYMVLTLVDAKNEYFTIIAIRNDKLITGGIYKD